MSLATYGPQLVTLVPSHDGSDPTSLAMRYKILQVHAVGALLHLASHDQSSRNAVVERLVGVLELRNAAAQMKSAEALAVLAGNSADNRTAITAANAIDPLVRILGDGRRARADTPQERAAAVLADLARSGENKQSIVDTGAVPPLVMMLTSEYQVVQTHAASTLAHLAALVRNNKVIADAGGIAPLVGVLAEGSADGQRAAAGALLHLATSADNRVVMVTAGVIPPLVKLLDSGSPDAREHSAAIMSALAVTQGGNKKAIFNAHGIKPLVHLLKDLRPATIRHAACALWGLSDGQDGIYDKHIVEYGAIPPLMGLLSNNNKETRGFTAACLLCLCKDNAARQAMLELGVKDPLLTLANGPATWLRGQAIEMLTLLGVPLAELDQHEPPPPWAANLFTKEKTVDDAGGTGDGGGRRSLLPQKHNSGLAERAPITLASRFKYHFFSFQTGKATGFMPKPGEQMRVPVEMRMILPTQHDGARSARP